MTTTLKELQELEKTMASKRSEAVMLKNTGQFAEAIQVLQEAQMAYHNKVGQLPGVSHKDYTTMKALKDDKLRPAFEQLQELETRFKEEQQQKAKQEEVQRKKLEEKQRQEEEKKRHAEEQEKQRKIEEEQKKAVEEKKETVEEKKETAEEKKETVGEKKETVGEKKKEAKKETAEEEKKQRQAEEKGKKIAIAADKMLDAVASFSATVDELATQAQQDKGSSRKRDIHKAAEELLGALKGLANDYLSNDPLNNDNQIKFKNEFSKLVDNAQKSALAQEPTVWAAFKSCLKSIANAFISLGTSNKERFYNTEPKVITELKEMRDQLAKGDLTEEAAPEAPKYSGIQ
ncbi:hypothetical protein [Legionella brunensis]|uniref:hypothetical protein n=1 Tax=Legionella brunensis TaxID=29422 RepID=UPI001041B24A|nr:hypothetical protein [Legionella brunensis]